MKKWLVVPAVVMAMSLWSCDPVDPVDPHDEELITTLNIDLDGGMHTATLNYVDADGDGGNDPVITVDTLLANTTYQGAITVLNESETPAEDITPEIFDEADQHQFFFATTGSANFAYLDQDNDGYPVGLSFELTTGVAGTENITVTLRHEPAKSAAGVADGDLTEAGGETDIEVVFEVIVE